MIVQRQAPRVPPNAPSSTPPPPSPAPTLGDRLFGVAYGIFTIGHASAWLLLFWNSPGGIKVLQQFVAVLVIVLCTADLWWVAVAAYRGKQRAYERAELFSYLHAFSPFIVLLIVNLRTFPLFLGVVLLMFAAGYRRRRGSWT